MNEVTAAKMVKIVANQVDHPIEPSEVSLADLSKDFLFTLDKIGWECETCAAGYRYMNENCEDVFFHGVHEHAKWKLNDAVLGAIMDNEAFLRKFVEQEGLVLEKVKDRLVAVRTLTRHF